MTGKNSFSQIKQLTPPNMTDLLDAHKKDIEGGFNCVQVGQIVSFDIATQAAQVQLVLKKTAAINPDGSKILREYPLLVDCPTVFPFGGASFISMPITPGDTCIVLFNDREIDQWFKNGGIQAPVSTRAHALADGIVIVGIKNLQNAISNYLANGIRMFFSATTKIDLTEENINSLATLFTHTGNMHITGDLTISGTTYGNAGDDWNINANIVQAPGFEIHDGRRVSGNFERVIVEDGIVIGGS